MGRTKQTETEMEPFTLAWAAQTMGAQIVERSDNGAGANIRNDATGRTVTSVSADTRRLAPGALFFALRGEHSDGHDYVAQAFAADAVGVVVALDADVSQTLPPPYEMPAGTLLVVAAPLHALGELAREYRQQFAIPVIGVTGSVGKTSTKEMIAAVLRTAGSPLASAKNHNNEIGVPQTLLHLNRRHQFAVIEMGMRGLGQIDRLAEIAAPTIGVITNIGYAHSELLGSQANIARAKAELFARLPPDGIAIAERNVWQWPVVRDSVPTGCRTIQYSRDGYAESDIYVPEGRTTPTPDGATEFDVCIAGVTYPIRLRAVGAHQVANALGALAVALALAIPIPQALAALEAWAGADNRMEVVKTVNGLTVLDDCYNAGPESVSMALSTLAQIAGEGANAARRVAVLGDMKELGKYAAGLHNAIGSQAALTRVALLITVGDLASGIGAGAIQHARRLRLPAPDVYHFETAQACAARIGEFVAPGDCVLVKGSRAMQMEKIVGALTGAGSPNAHD